MNWREKLAELNTETIVGAVDGFLASPLAGKISKAVSAFRADYEPKREACDEACVSCPFREGNDSEWSKLVKRMSEAGHGMMTPWWSEKPEILRARIRAMVTAAPQFFCHSTAYTKDGATHPPVKFKHCAGAVVWARTGQSIPKEGPK